VLGLAGLLGQGCDDARVELCAPRRRDGGLDRLARQLVAEAERGAVVGEGRRGRAPPRPPRRRRHDRRQQAGGTRWPITAAASTGAARLAPSRPTRASVASRSEDGRPSRAASASTTRKRVAAGQRATARRRRRRSTRQVATGRCGQRAPAPCARVAGW
jgi:hypothetical protein